jgi:diguanylate cyclase (GGDEF)-like protein
LEEFAYYDPLTSLPNRRSFLQSFHQAAVMARRQASSFALLLVDLDRLKLANDTLGHDAGDVLLVEASARIKGAVRDGDVVARVGGDEFAIIVTDLESDAALEEICRRLVDAFAPAVAFKGGALETSPSIGIAMFPRDGDDEDAVYKAADLALFAAKRGGRNTWRWFHPDLAA